MKKYFLIFLSLFFIQNTFSQKQKVVAAADGKCAEEKWVLDFEDNFDGTSLNTNTWVNRVSSQGTLINEGVGMYLTLDNIKIENGICKMIPKKEKVTRKAVSWQPDSLILGDGLPNLRTYDFTSAFIETKNQYLYGKFEIRCKIPKEKGMWPAFWMYGEKDKVNNEIDVFEFWNSETIFGKYNPKKSSKVVRMTVHYNHKFSGKKYEGVDYSQDFHIFTVVWDSTKIEWFVDGESIRLSTYYQTKSGKNVECKDVKAGKTYYTNPIFPNEKAVIIANLGIQSGDNAPEVNTFSNSFDIDYIRYYKSVP